MSKEEIMYDDARLKEVLCANHKSNASELTKIILNDVKHFTKGADQYDDETVLIFEFKDQSINKELNNLFFE